MIKFFKKNRKISLFNVLLILLINVNITLDAQEMAQHADTLYLKAGSRIEFLNSAEYIPKDTVLIINSSTKYIIHDPRDSTTKNLYKSLKTYSEKNKILELIHNSIIVDRKMPLRQVSGTFNKSFVEYSQYIGKRIARIYFKRVRLFSGSVEDTTNLINQEKQKLLERVHFDTKVEVIKKFLTFQEGDTIKPHELSDSERILRGLSFIEDAKIIVDSLKNDSNSVNIFVVTKDRFSLGLKFIPHSIKRVSASIYDRNVLGYGWNSEVEYTLNKEFKNPNGIAAKMNFVNIDGMFVDAELAYYYDENREGARIVFSKPFVTVKTKYGGGVTFENLHSYYIYSDTLKVPYTNRYDDLWFSRQFSISSQDRNKTLFLAGRVANREFTTRPYVSPDSNYFFYDENLVLASVIYSKIDYYKSRLIYGFGITEDIPVGSRFGITGGILYDDFYKYNYFGLNAGQSFISASFGYLLFGMKYGGLYHDMKFKHGSIYLYSKYISPLIRFGTFNYRHFLYVGYAEVLNRQRDYYLHFKDENSVRGLSLSSLRGTKRLDISYEGLMFAPFNVYGFRFVTYGFGDLGILGDSHNSLFNNKIYSGIGVGWRIKNESLVFATIQIRLAYYPNTVNAGSKFGFNIKTSNTRLFKNYFPVKPEILDLR